MSDFLSRLEAKIASGICLLCGLKEHDHNCASRTDIAETVVLDEPRLCFACHRLAPAGRPHRCPRRGNSKIKSVRKLTYLAFGERKTISDWAKDPRCVVGRGALKDRVRKGWPFFSALTTPRGMLRNQVWGEKKIYQHIVKKAREFGVIKSTSNEKRDYPGDPEEDFSEG